MNILAILRAKQFSPNSVEKDEAIMMAVVSRLRAKGHAVEVVPENTLLTLHAVPTGKIILSMGRTPETLRWLSRQDACVVNSPESVALCQSRTALSRVMKETGTPQPLPSGPDGYWLKRDDGAARQQGDVVFAKDKADLWHQLVDFRQRGINDYTVSANIVGDVVKFYGVRGTGFFRYFYPTDDGDTKFGDEWHNGPAHHYPFDTAAFHQCVERLATAVGIDIFGGDTIVRNDGTFCIIDFNDWPSFSRCREEAADAITTLAVNRFVHPGAIRGYIFDYGGTLDTGGCHWGKFILHAYQHMDVPVTEEQFRQAYVYAERYVAQHPVILPDDTFRQTLEKKVSLQLQYLQLTPSYLSPLTSYLYQKVCRHISHSRDILQQIAQPKVLVSNFYGNLQTVLHEFSFDSLFSGVIESAVVGVRKPDPSIFALGLESLQLPPGAVAVVGDSIDKDILPATSIGCRTIWFRGEQWTDTLVVPPDACVTINDLSELLTMNPSTN